MAMKLGFQQGHAFLTRDANELVQELTGIPAERLAIFERNVGLIRTGRAAAGLEKPSKRPARRRAEATSRFRKPQGKRTTEPPAT